MICSHAIQLIEDFDPKAVVVYHFYRFDRTYSGREMLQILAGQLFEGYEKRTYQVDDELYLKTRRRACSLENVQELITALVKSLPKTYFFIDGLDEEDSPARWPEASTVLDFLIQLSMESPDTVRVWYSSQFRPCISNKLHTHTIFDIKDQVRADVIMYLSCVIPDIDELGEDLMKKLEKRVDGNFLCASLMINELDKAINPTARREVIEGDLPENNFVDESYRKIFNRIEKAHRPLAQCVSFSWI